MPKRKTPAPAVPPVFQPAVPPALIHENYVRACKAGLVMREADFRRRFHTMKDGLGKGSSSLEESMAVLGEDPAEFKSFLALIERTFVPKDLPERQVVRRLASGIWRRLRLFKAAARWEEDALRQALSSGPELADLTVDETLVRAYAVMTLLLDETRLDQSRGQLLAEVERQFRDLIRIRSGGKAKFRTVTRQASKEERELEEEEKFWRAMDRIEQGGPEVEAILKNFRNK